MVRNLRVQADRPGATSGDLRTKRPISGGPPIGQNYAGNPDSRILATTRRGATRGGANRGPGSGWARLALAERGARIGEVSLARVGIGKGGGAGREGGRNYPRASPLCESAEITSFGFSPGHDDHTGRAAGHNRPDIPPMWKSDEITQFSTCPKDDGCTSPAAGRNESPQSCFYFVSFQRSGVHNV